MSSHNAINDFMNANSIDGDQFGNLKFSAFIEYSSSARNISQITDVTIIRNGYDDGKIRLMEAEELVAEDFHLDFSTQYQTYSFFDNDKKLLVSGSSQKMGGKYKVSIKLL